LPSIRADQRERAGFLQLLLLSWTFQLAFHFLVTFARFKNKIINFPSIFMTKYCFSIIYQIKRPSKLLKRKKNWHRFWRAESY
ncbi:MAG: hypothetical protein ACYTXY_30160, partial [Nostoc sp.]